jgi:hypothetical protein
MTRGVAER